MNNTARNTVDLNLGVIGNCSFNALIDRHGRVVWSCMPRPDSEPVFNALLSGKDLAADDTQGIYDVTMEGEVTTHQTYEDNTAILVTRLESTMGAVEIVDFAPRFNRFGRRYRPVAMVRLIRPVSGMPRIRIRVRPTFNYGSEGPVVTHGSNHIRYVGARQTLRLTTDAPLTYVLNESWFKLERTLSFFLGPDESLTAPVTDMTGSYRVATAAYWREWVRTLATPFEWQEAVIRADHGFQHLHILVCGRASASGKQRACARDFRAHAELLQSRRPLVRGHRPGHRRVVGQLSADLRPGRDHQCRHTPQPRLGFFFHTPWPPAELISTLPENKALVRAMFAYDVVGFQTENDVRAFLDYVLHEAEGTLEDDGRVTCYGRTIHVAAFPIGIDAATIAAMAVQPEARTHAARMVDSLSGRRLIIGVDRLDYSKGIDRRFRAYGKLLERNPEHRAKISMLQIVPPSRMKVASYQAMRRQLEREMGHVNGQFADYDWVPLRYVNKAYNHIALVGLYRSACAAMVTPLRDGMNLVAKEYVAAQNPDDPGVLILSRFAGAACQLKTALIVNPYDEASMVDALHRALSMPLEERRQPWEPMMASVTAENIDVWRESFLSALAAA